jgi:hypothetical protein
VRANCRERICLSIDIRVDILIYIHLCMHVNGHMYVQSSVVLQALPCVNSFGCLQPMVFEGGILG